MMLDLINGNKTYFTAILLIVFGIGYYFAPTGIASWESPAGEVEGVVRNVVSPILVGIGIAVASLRHAIKKTELNIIAALKK